MTIDNIRLINCKKSERKERKRANARKNLALKLVD